MLIRSVSGVRGLVNLGSKGLSPKVVKKCVKQFIYFTFSHSSSKSPFIVTGRDGRSSGNSILNLVEQTCLDYNIGVLSLGITTTPSVQMAIMMKKIHFNRNCLGGIMISASHNPIEWNGLKLMNSTGEFFSSEESSEVFQIDTNLLDDQLLKLKNDLIKANKMSIDFFNYHIEEILNLKDVNVEKIRSKKFKIVVDGINSSGGIYVPYLLDKLGLEVVTLNCEPNGIFAHNPEPIPENLSELCHQVIAHNADLGIAIDPDVDRLVLIAEDGSFFGEEYTIVSIVKYILTKYPGSNVVSNISTTQAVKKITHDFGSKHFESKVGEANVVKLMKEKNAIIGGEGSGGVIFAPSHLGRDALVGIGLFLSFLSDSDMTVKQLRSTLPRYHMIKNKILISNNISSRKIIDKIQDTCDHLQYDYTTLDGIKFYFDSTTWVHIRVSNTEPIIRLIIESDTLKKAQYSKDVINSWIKEFL